MMNSSGSMLQKAARIGCTSGCRLSAVAWPVVLGAGPATAAELPLAAYAMQQGAAGISMMVGMAVFATTTALLHLSGRRRWTLRERELSSRINVAEARAQRIETILAGEPQTVLSWGARGEKPLVEGDIGLPDIAGNLLAFGTWAVPASAQQLEAAVDRLKDSGESFALTMKTKRGGLIEVRGRAVGGRAVVHLKDVTGLAADISHLAVQHKEARENLDVLRALIDGLPHPVWSRDATGNLLWVNRAYLHAVEAATVEDAIARGLELLDADDRRKLTSSRGDSEASGLRAPAVVAGRRRILEVCELPLPSGSAGIAIDVTQVEEARADLERQMQAHAATMDRLTTAVAIFDGRQTLVFRNPAFDRLWGFEPDFLDSGPTHGELLDRQRTLRRTPELGEFKAWKAGVLAAYSAAEPCEDWWYLPDGRVIQAVTTPNPQGGITMLFDDATEQRSLESKVNTLGRVQNETLEALREGVAVFGSDGRLRFGNPAFATMWHLDPAMLADGPHVDAVAGACAPLVPNGPGWSELVGMVAGVRDARHEHAQRFELADGKILDCTLSALPDGGTLLTFVDMTDSANVERALKENAEVQAKAAKLREDFVHRVSYELRSPLTNIIGFAQLIDEGAAGPLTTRQREYTEHILRSSGTLLEHVNDILDLAAMDNGDFELHRSEVDLAAVIRSAGDSLTDRLNDKSIRFIAHVAPAADRLFADEQRLRQIIRNLLSNAISFSSAGAEVRVEGRADGDGIEVIVSDDGCGIPEDVQRRVFGRFESDSQGSSHRGVGLGLAIAKSLVEQHGGSIRLASQPGRGTIVTCRFPRQGSVSETAVA